MLNVRVVNSRLEIVHSGSIKEGSVYGYLGLSRSIGSITGLGKENENLVQQEAGFLVFLVLFLVR